MSFKKKQLIKLSGTILISFFAMRVVSGCGGSNGLGKISIDMVPTNGNPSCPQISWFYSDYINSQRCIADDNYKGSPSIPDNGLEVVGVCTSVWTNNTQNYTQLNYSDVIINCASGNVMSSSDTNLTPVSLPDAIRPTKLNDVITYQVTCYVFGEKRAQQSANYTAAGTCT